MMFITQSQHRRDTLGRGSGRRQVVSDEGLGIVVKQTTKFDPRRMARRREYWYRLYYDEVVRNMAQAYRDAGFEGLSGLGQGGISPLPLDTIINPMKLIHAPLKKIPVVGQFAAPMEYVFDAFTLGLTKILPKIPVIGKIFSSIFGGGAPSIPWGEIYAKAEELARPASIKTAREEEQARIAKEGYRTEIAQQTAIEKESQKAVQFQLPEGAMSVRRGALVMALKGQPVEKKVG